MISPISDPNAPQWARDFQREVQNAVDEMERSTLRFVGSYASVTDLPTAPRFSQSVAYVVATRDLYYYDGTQWSTV